MASKAAIELIISMQDKASKQMDALAKKGGGLGKVFATLGKGTKGVTGLLGVLGKGVKGLALPFSLATGGAALLTGALGKKFVDAANEAEQAQAQLNAVITSTKGAANVTADSVSKLADKLSSKGGLSRATDEAIVSGASMLLTFTNIKNGVGENNQVFDQATSTLLDMATAMNQGAAPSAEQLAKQAVSLGKALNDPIAGIGALSRVGVTFTEDQKTMIKGMVEAGDVMGAQKIILEELGKEFGGSALASAQTFAGQMQTLQERVGDVQERIGMALLPALKSVVEWLSSPEVGAGIEAFAGGMERGIGKVTDFLGSQEFRAKFDTVKTIVGGAFQGAWDLAVKAGEAARPKIQAAIEYFKSPEFQSTFATAKKTIGDGLAGAWDAIEPKVTWAKENVLAPFFEWLKSPEVSSALENTGNAIGTILAGRFKTMSDAADLAWNSVLKPFWTWLSTPATQETLGKFGEAVLNLAVSGFGFLETAVRGVIGALSEFDKKGADSGNKGNIFGWLENDMTMLTEWANNATIALDALNVAMQIMQNPGKAIPSFDPSKIELPFDPMPGDNKLNPGMKPGGGLFDGIMDAAKNAVKAVSDAFQKSTIAADVQKMGAGAVSALESAWGISSPSKVFTTIGLMAMLGLSSGIMTGGGTARASAMSVSAGVRSSVAGPLASGQFVSIGVAIPLGIARGIQSTTGAAVAAARSMALQVAQAARTTLAIKSPSKIFEEIGKLANAGMALGMGDNKAVLATTEGAIKQVIELAKRVVGKGTEELMSSFGSIMDDVGKVFGALSDMGNPDAKMPLAATIDAFFTAFDRVIPEIQFRLLRWWKAFDEEKAKLAGFIGDAVDGLLGTVDVFAKLADPDLLFPTDFAITAFFMSLDKIIPDIQFRLLRWYGAFDEVKSDLSKHIGLAVNGLLDAVNGFAKLADPKLLFPTDFALDGFFLTLDRFLPDLQFRLLKWWGTFDQIKADLAERIGEAVNGLLAAVNGFQTLGDPKNLWPTQFALDAFFITFDAFIPELQFRILRWTGAFDAAKAELTKVVGESVNGILGAITGFSRLADPKLLWPIQFAVDAFFITFDAFIPDLQFRLLRWWGAFDPVKAELAKNIGEAVNGLLGALTGFLKLGDPKNLWPTQFAIEAFFLTLDQFLEKFEERAEEWLAKAPGVLAELAGKVGEIAVGLGKVLDPILKMGDAQKITSEQIEGAMANVWFALDQFNAVMTGGSQGTAFQGEWTTRAVAFAQSIGTIFTELQKALGTVAGVSGGGGFAQAMADVSLAWNSVFGDINTEDTLLNRLFRKDASGFFFRLSDQTRVALDTYKYEWGGHLENLGKYLTLIKLPEMLIVAKEFGTSMAKALADAFGAEMSAQQGAISSAISGAFGGIAITPGGPSLSIPPSQGSGQTTNNRSIQININNPGAGVNGRQLGQEIVRVLEDAGLHDRLVHP